MFDEVKNVLSEDEFNALFAPINSSTKEKWLYVSALAAHRFSGFGKTDKEAKDLVEALINKQILGQSQFVTDLGCFAVAPSWAY